MSKYSHFEMCEKIFGSRYKFDKVKELVPYSRTDMWDKMIEQQDKISDLEAKLAESEEQVKHWHDLYNDRDKQFQSVRQRYHLLNKLQSNYDKKDKLHLVYMQCAELVDENEKLKQQLAEKETRIAELEDKDWYEGTIKQLEEQNGKLIEERDNAKLQLAEKDAEIRVAYSFRKQKCDNLQKALAEKDKEISNLRGLVNERNKQIKNLKTNKKRVIEHKNNVKIEFAIEKLEKVKEEIDKRPLTVKNCGYGEFEEILLDDVYDVIDNQINELKEKK